MATIKYYDKRVNVTYIYESKSYFDEASQKFKAKRRLIGKLDPVTGDVVPTGKRGRPSQKTETMDSQQTEDTIDYKLQYEKATQTISQRDEWIKFLEDELNNTKKELKDSKARIKEIGRLCCEAQQE